VVEIQSYLRQVSLVVILLRFCFEKDSVASVSQVFAVDKKFLVERLGMLPEHLQEEIDEGLRAILYL
jgi:mRNA-degrading endonuclease toxin of MazEF toxin-antitoxin module